MSLWSIIKDIFVHPYWRVERQLMHKRITNQRREIVRMQAELDLLYYLLEK